MRAFARLFTESERFLLKVTPLRGCWSFAGEPRSKKAGYLAFQLSTNRTELAHRYMWMLANKRRVPKGKVVRHTCDNPKCVNPHHLVLGTYKDNTQDAVSRDRMARGERNSQAKLTADQAREIRCRWKAGVRQVDLAKEFGISQAAVSLVCTRKNWRRVK